MSRGLGKIERAILEALEREAQRLGAEDDAPDGDRETPLLSTRALYFAIYADLPWQNPLAQYNALTRALRSLRAKRLAFRMRLRRGMLWTDRQGADDYVAWTQEFRAGVSGETESRVA